MGKQVSGPEMDQQLPEEPSLRRTEADGAVPLGDARRLTLMPAEPTDSLRKGWVTAGQKTAGNRAVARLLAERGGRPKSPTSTSAAPAQTRSTLTIQREQSPGGNSGTSRYTDRAQAVEAWFNSHAGPYTIQLCTTEKGAFGHAWIQLAASDGNAGAIGFYPSEMFESSDWAKNALSGVPGRVNIQDPDMGKQEHLIEQQVDGTKARKMLDVIQAYQTQRYVLTKNNCSTFATSVWTAVTGAPPPGGPDVWWMPAAISWSIQERDTRRHEIEQALAAAESKLDQKRPAAARYY